MEIINLHQNRRKGRARKNTFFQLMFTPEFPQHNYLELQRSKIQVGDPRVCNYETTYGDANRPRTRQSVKQEIDTVTLQKTHWTTGNIPTTTLSEMHDKYRPNTANVTRDPALSRDAMMKTTFTIGDPNAPFSQRQMQQVGHVGPVKYENYREQFTATHFNLTNSDGSKWQTTSRDSYRPYTAAPSDQAHMELNRGYGAKSTFQQYGAFQTNESDYSRSFKNPGRPTTALSASVNISGNSILFDQGTTQKWQRTNHKMKGPQMDYTTTTQDSFCKNRNLVEVVDPAYARLRRSQLSKSSVSQATKFETVKESSAHAGVKAHPGFLPPPPAEATAYKSHFKNAEKSEPMRTTTQDAYGPKPFVPVPPADLSLQKSHMKIGAESLTEKRSLYQDTFTKPPRTVDRVDADACRAFHTAHHTKTSSENSKTGMTTYEESFRPNRNFKPPPPCDALKGGHNIVPNESRFDVRESSMKSDFKPPCKVEQAKRTDNALQRSHLQLTSPQAPWTTTQGEYFRFKTYKMPSM